MNGNNTKDKTDNWQYEYHIGPSENKPIASKSLIEAGSLGGFKR